MKPKHYVFLSILFIYYLTCTIKYISAYRADIKTECGTVIEDFTELCSVKHGTNTEYYLKIKYSDRIAIERVNAKTFYNNHKVGSLICFNIENKIPIWAEIGFITINFVIFILLILLVFYLIS